MANDIPTGHTVTPLEGDVLADLASDSAEAVLSAHSSLGGCFRLPIPSPVPIELCWRFVPPKTFRVCLKVGGVELTCVDIPVNECASFEANTPVTKLRLSVCTRTNDRQLCLTYGGEFCLWVPFEWHCWGLEGAIICIPI